MEFLLGQHGPRAVVLAVAEGHLLGEVLAVNVDLVRILEDARIAVAGGKSQVHGRTLGDGHAGQGHVFLGDAPVAGAGR